MDETTPQANNRGGSPTPAAEICCASANGSAKWLDGKYVWIAVKKSTGELDWLSLVTYEDEQTPLVPEYEWRKFALKEISPNGAAEQRRVGPTL